LQLSDRHHLASIRSKLITLVLACALPILIGYVVFARDAARRERVHIEQDAQTVAQVLAAAVDRDLASGQAAARVLANSPSLAAGDLAAFHQGARHLLRPDFPAHAFMLSGADGKPLLDTRETYGTPLAAQGNEAAIRRVFASGDALTSGLHRADARAPWLISIEVPVWRDGKVAYVLSVLQRPKRMAELLDQQNLPPHWFAAVYDDQQRLVARSIDQAGAAGARMEPSLAAALAHAGRGVAALAPEDGVSYQSAFSRSPGRGWTVSVAFPREAAREMLGHSQAAVLLGIAALLATSLGLAWRIGGSIAHAVRALTAPAAALGRGEALDIPELPLHEAAAVADALRQVERELVGYRTRLEALVAERTAELERSNALLETVYTTAPVGLYFMDREMRFVMINDYLAALKPLPAGEHVGRTLYEVMDHDTAAEIERYHRHVLETGRPLVGIERSNDVPAEPGVMRHWLASYYPVFGPDRAIAGVNAVVLDITERKLLEQRNRDNEELFRALYESSCDANMLVASGAGFVSANQAAATMFGCETIDEFLTLSPASASPEFQPNGRRSSEMADEYVRTALETGGNHFEWLHRRRDGSTFHADVVLTSVDIGGKGIVQALVRDISARVATEEALRAAGIQLAERERFIRTVTDNLPALVGYWDADLRCRFANRSYLAWLGRAEHEVLGHGADELLGEAHRSEAEPQVNRVLAGEPQTFERELRGADGAPIHTLSSYIPDFDQHGKVRGFHLLMTDVTELKRTGDRLARALREAEQANQAKGQFLANMSHEIRTPMNAIMGLARLLEEAPLGQRERGYAERMKIAAKSLLGMLNDVLDFSRAESGQLKLEHRPFRLDEVLDSISVLVASNAWDKGVEPVFAVAPGVPALLVGDAMRLGQVLLNLVGNAIKFTAEGEVVLAIRVLRHAPGRVRLAFTVRDTGIGIAPEQQQRMFEAFSQADSSTSRKYGGAGLGLAISRRLAELMGASLQVRSALGEGAEFALEAEFALAETDDAPSAPPPGLRLLVADDNASAGEALAEACAAFGWQVERAQGGREAAELLLTRHYDLAFLDSAMPDLDGVAVLARARAGGAAALPRCALMAAEREHETLAPLAGQLGIGAMLAKPVTPGALRAAVARLLGSEAALPAPSASALAARLRGLRVLLVEDNQINQEVANHILTHAGATVDIAADGRAAVDMLASGAREYDVVLMDLQMPVMNGFEATRAIRALGFTELPVVAMSANAMEEDRRSACEAGMTDHLSKPIEVEQLLVVLDRVAGRAPHPSPAPSAAAGAPCLAAQAVLPPLPGIDLRAALARFGGDAAAFSALLRRLEGSEGHTPAQVRAFLARGERGAARQRLHRLRGVAANLGATEVAGLALESEQALAGDGEQALAGCLDRLAEALDRLLVALRALPADVAGAPRQAAMDATATNGDLKRLLELLQANNMTALDQFAALRPALARMLAPQDVAALDEAVGTLRFDAAAALLCALLD
jgi:two-component system, sensor histidine kinase and response regulator